MEKLSAFNEAGFLIETPCSCHETRLDGAEARLRALEGKVSEIIVRYNALVPGMQAVAKLIDYADEYGASAKSLNEELESYMNQIAGLIVSLRAELEKART